jgi:hypothetical protein
MSGSCPTRRGLSSVFELTSSDHSPTVEGLVSRQVVPLATYQLSPLSSDLIPSDGTKPDQPSSPLAADDHPVVGSPSPLTVHPYSAHADPVIVVSPSQPSGPSSVQFDVLRSDPISSSLQHVASSKTKWTSIPRLPFQNTILAPSSTESQGAKTKDRRTRRAFYAPGLNPLVDTTRASLASARSSDVVPTPSTADPDIQARVPTFALASENTLALSSAPASKCPFLEPAVGHSSTQMDWQVSSLSQPSSFVYGPSKIPALSAPIEISLSLSPDLDMSEHHESARAQAAFEAEVQSSSPIHCAQSGPSVPSSSYHRPPIAMTNVDLPLDDSTCPLILPAETANGNKKRKKPCDLVKRHTCPRCGRAFHRPSSLRVHGRAHTGFRRKSASASREVLSGLIVGFHSVCLSVCRMWPVVQRELEHAPPFSHTLLRRQQ